MGDDSGSLKGRRVILMGPPGSGKGTQAAILSEYLKVPSISTGEMLRQAVESGSLLGRRVESILDSGGLVDDETIVTVVSERLSRRDARSGFLLDGYPRTLKQAESLVTILGRENTKIDAVIMLEVPTEEIIKRARARQRSDDKEEVVRERLRVYQEMTYPLLGYFEKEGCLKRVDGDRPIEEVARELKEIVGS